MTLCPILFQDAARFALRVFLSAEGAVARHHTHRRRPFSALNLGDFDKSRGFIALKEISGKHVIVLPKMAVDFSSAFAHSFSLQHLVGLSVCVWQPDKHELFNSSEMRLARALLLLANYGNDLGQEPMHVKVNQETLAAMIGTTRSRVNYFMNKFRRLALIDYNGKLEVHKALLNFVLNERPHIETQNEEAATEVA